nr:SDR family oxidoreductase [Mesorhizobium sp.]
MHSHIDQALKDRIAANLPIRRMGQPDDMAAAILFLCSGAASFVYSAALDVDGGSMFRLAACDGRGALRPDASTRSPCLQ